MTGRRAAGFLLWRSSGVGAGAGAGVEVLLAHPGGPLFAGKDHGVWTVPKGEPEPGEDDLAAARREFREEIGAEPPATDPVPLGEARQRGGKTNVVWALHWPQPPARAATGGSAEAADGSSADLLAGDAGGCLDLASRLSAVSSVTMQWPPRSGRSVTFPEVDQACWFAVARARERIRDGQEVFLDRLLAVLAGAVPPGVGPADVVPGPDGRGGRR